MWTPWVAGFPPAEQFFRKDAISAKTSKSVAWEVMAIDSSSRCSLFAGPGVSFTGCKTVKKRPANEPLPPLVSGVGSPIV
jgi:hypothetical protein